MTQEFILGGYTKRENQGIQQISFDPESVSFSEPTLIAELENPTYVALNQAQDLLFAIHKEGDQGGIAGFKKVDGQWKLFDTEMGSDVPGCHLTYREASQTVYVANYHLGQIDVYQLTDDQLQHIQVVKHEGNGPHENQDSSHVHFTGLNKAQDLLFVCDLGADTVTSYTFEADGQITYAHDIELPGGTGPRHLVLDNEEEYAYVIGELDSTTISLKVSDDGVLTFVERYLNIPKEAVETSNGAAIRITKDNRFLYVSSRFYDAIIGYQLEGEGKLSKIQALPSHGEIPRDFILDETEQYLLVPHQDTDNIAIFEINQENGQLTFVHDETHAPECVCIMPLK
ncbi:lactonase family protein [Aerococcaceae bacterium DSM 111020]|nr:lactonase family protein [Aerococcaceae bacterium DSM 111020]